MLCGLRRLLLVPSEGRGRAATGPALGDHLGVVGLWMDSKCALPRRTAATTAFAIADLFWWWWSHHVE